MANYRVIGKPVERVDGPEMLSGQAIYGPDVKLPGMLWGKILRSPIPHAKVLRVDVEKARNHPGVKAVIAAKDVPARRYGYAVEDEHIFAIDKVHFVGQPVAAVAAVDEDTAEEALSLIEVEYEEMPAVFDAEEAIRDGAPLVHDNLAELNARSVYLASWYPVQGTNIIHHASNERGNVEAALKKADYVFEDEFSSKPNPSQLYGTSRHYGRSRRRHDYGLDLLPGSLRVTHGHGRVFLVCRKARCGLSAPKSAAVSAAKSSRVWSRSRSRWR